MNFPEFGTVVVATSQIMRKESQVSRPSTFITFADGGAVTAATKNLSADEWLPDTSQDAATMQTFGGGIGYFRVPSNGYDYKVGDSRSLPRHSKRCNFGFFDGHVERLKNSQAGYNFYITGSGAATPQPEGAWWAISH
jgi:prepilin-type processing-associated H-X9-DG protein